VVENEAEVAESERLIDAHDLGLYTIQTLANGANGEFLRRCAFRSRREIFSEVHGFHAIDERRRYNENFMGYIRIAAEGDVFSDSRKPPLGNVGRERLDRVLAAAPASAFESWRMTRLRIEPCRDCAYALLCESPGSLEVVLGRNNLCDVRP
jgi:pseudo-rSAM protein